MAKTLSKTGISTGQDILAGHVTQSVDALTGTEAYDITISGSLRVSGPITNPTSTINNLTSSYAITASHALNGGSGGGFTPSLSTNLPAQNITASANISASGYVSASVINVGGGTFTSASLAAGGSGGFTPSLSTDLPAQNITASANISASGHISASSFHGTELISPNDLTLDTNSADILLKNNGVAFGRLKTVSNFPNFVIKSEVKDRDIIFKGNDDGTAIDALRLDMSDAGAAIFNNRISASNSIYGNNYYVQNIQFANYHPPTQTIRLGWTGDNTLLYGTTITLNANVTASGNILIEGGGLDIKNSGAQSYARFYCESGNAHYTELKAQPHVLYSGNPITLLPAYDFDFAKPNFQANITASGNISASGILSIPGFPNVSASLANATGGGGSAAGTEGMIQLSDGASGFKTGTGNQFYYDNGGNLVVGDGFDLYYISQSIGSAVSLTLGDATNEYNSNIIKIPNGPSPTPIEITGSLDILGTITASGNISASGNVYAANITASSITATTVTSTNLGGSIVGYRPIITHTTNFTSTSSYAGHYNIVGGTLSITVTTGSTPTDLTPGMEWDFFQTSSGTSFTFTEGAGVEIISRNNHKKLAAVGSAATLKYISGQTFHLVGDLTI